MRVLQPVVDRTYDPNPQGSATATVTMAAAMPFQRAVRVTRYGSRPANVAGLGDDPGAIDSGSLSSNPPPDDTSFINAQYAPAVTPVTGTAATPATAAQPSTSLLDQFASALTKASATVVQGAATNVANRLTGQTAKPASTFSAIATSPSWLLIGGVVAVGGLGLWLMMRKKPSAAPVTASRRRR